MTQVPNWYVITGSPSSGTTSTIKYLGKLGYYVIEEAARRIINEEIAKGKDVEEIRRNEGQFQKRVFKRKLELLEVATRDKIVFFDKGIPDSLAYYEMNGLELTEVLNHCQEKLYRKVFFLERLPYRKDYARIEDEDTSERIEQLSRKWYVLLGYVVISIPVFSVRERANMILSYIV